MRHVGIIVVAALIGYLGAGLALNQQTFAATAATPTVQPTPTVARAVTFTPTVLVTGTATTTPEPTASAVPASPTAALKTTPKPTPKPTLAPEYYVVQSGDTIEGISNKLGVSEDAIIRANSLSDPNQLSLGQKLVIPK